MFFYLIQRMSGRKEERYDIQPWLTKKRVRLLMYNEDFDQWQRKLLGSLGYDQSSASN